MRVQRNVRPWLACRIAAPGQPRDEALVLQGGYQLCSFVVGCRTVPGRWRRERLASARWRPCSTELPPKWLRESSRKGSRIRSTARTTTAASACRSAPLHFIATVDDPSLRWSYPRPLSGRGATSAPTIPRPLTGPSPRSSQPILATLGVGGRLRRAYRWIGARPPDSSKGRYRQPGPRWSSLASRRRARPRRTDPRRR